MFTRWLNVKLLAAEKALHEGRIDDVVQLAAEPAVRDHRRGRELIAELRTPLLARTRLHLASGRYADAMLDLDRLEALGLADRDSIELRDRAIQELRGRQDEKQQSREAFDKAAANVRAGRLDSARAALDQLANVERFASDPRRSELEQELDIRLRRSEQLLDEARRALRDGDAPTALRLWEEAAGRHGRTSETDRFAGELAAEWRGMLEKFFANGQIDRFCALARAGKALMRVDPMLEEFGSRTTLLADAATQFSRGDLSGLRATLMRLSGAARGAKWIADALAAVTEMIAARDLLLASPLGQVASAEHVASVEKSPRIVTAERAARGDNPCLTDAATAPERAAATIDAAAHEPLLMLVDGTGSCMILRREMMRIGRAGGERGIDVPIPADVQSHHADIVRNGEDYFLMAHGPTRVNGRDARRVLLRDGDRITLGSNARMTFRKPSERSGTAVLMLSDRARLAQDVDRVVLLSDTCMIGPDASCHVRTREGDTRLVAFVRDGRMYVRMRPRNDGGNAHPAEPMSLGETRDWGDIRLTLKAYDARWTPAA